MKQTINTFLLCTLLLIASITYGQNYTTVKNAHSHNDYFRNVPFYTSYSQRFASIEADIFAIDGELYVAHEQKEITPERTFRALYLEPIIREMDRNKGKGYPDGCGFQLLIDLKTNCKETLPLLEKQLLEYRRYFDRQQDSSAVRIVISGNRPTPAQFGQYDDIIFFDGRPDEEYTPEQAKRIALISAPFMVLSKWNGLGRMTHSDIAQVKKLIDETHRRGMTLRFWGCPDTKTAWNTFMKLGVDYINTDKPEALAQFLGDYTQFNCTSASRHTPYTPTYKTDGSNKRPKNVILLISDGGGINHLWAAATVNGGQMNILGMKNMGWLKNNPLDDYTTDSAGAGSALATGRKSRNRYIGSDTTGQPVANLTELLADKGISTAIITNDNITGATPAAFFAHQPERDMSREIALDLQHTPAKIIIGNCQGIRENKNVTTELQTKGVTIHDFTENLVFNAQSINVCHAKDQQTPGYRVIENALPKVLQHLSTALRGFFIMTEGAKIDSGGHANDMKQVVDEYLSFDRTVGKALEFADKNGETLVIVVSDHETGGLTLIDGNYSNGRILGNFTTNDHTGTPVLLFAYGPSSQTFCGFDENTSIYTKLADLLK